MYYWLQFILTVVIGTLGLQVYGYMRKPSVKWVRLKEKNAEHDLFEVKIRPDIKFPSAVLAQEIAEIKWMWLRGFGVFPLNFVLPKIPAVMRSLEIWGHEVEVQMYRAVGGPIHSEYRWQEARNMAFSDSYPQFAGWTPRQIQAKMLKYDKRAEKWVRDNFNFIRGLME